MVQISVLGPNQVVILFLFIYLFTCLINLCWGPGAGPWDIEDVCQKIIILYPNWSKLSLSSHNKLEDVKCI